MARTQIDSSLVPSGSTAASNLPNILDNGGFEIWQRGTTFSSPANLVYTADRWKVETNEAANVTVTQETTTIDMGLASMKVVVTAAGGGTNWRVANIIENVADYRGKTITFSARVNTVTANAIKLRIGTNMGSINSTNFHTGSGWETLTLSYTVESTATNLVVYIGMISNGNKTAGTYYFDSAMLVIGSTSATFVPTHPQQDLARCQRYYEASGQITMRAYGAYDGGSSRYELAQFVTFAMQKRTTPTIVLTPGTVWEDGVAGNFQANYSFIAGNSFPNGFEFMVFKSTGGQRPVLFQGSYTASSDL